jgi:hypothetical protein
MTEKAISPLLRRLIENMAICRLDPKTQQQYIRHVKKFADFLARSAEKATLEDVRRYQVWLASIGTTVGKTARIRPNCYPICYPDSTSHFCALSKALS